MLLTINGKKMVSTQTNRILRNNMSLPWWQVYFVKYKKGNILKQTLVIWAGGACKTEPTTICITFIRHGVPKGV